MLPATSDEECLEVQRDRPGRRTASPRRAASRIPRASSSPPVRPIDSACSGARARADARLQAPHALGTVSAQIDRRILPGQQRRQVRLGAHVHVDRARSLRSPARIGAARRPALLVALTTTHRVVVVAAAPQPHEHARARGRTVRRLSSESAWPSARGRRRASAAATVRAATARRRSRRAAGSPASSRRGPVWKMKWTGGRCRPGARPRRPRDGQPRALGGRPQDAVVEEARGAIGAPRRVARAGPSRGRGRASADRRRATRAIAPADHAASVGRSERQGSPKSRCVALRESERQSRWRRVERLGCDRWRSAVLEYPGLTRGGGHEPYHGLALSCRGALAAVLSRPPPDAAPATSDGLVAVQSRTLDEVYIRPDADLSAYRKIIVDPAQPRSGRTG